MTGIKFDASWVGGYAKLAGNSAEALAEGAKTMGIAPLDQESFGELGRTVHTTQAYGKAAQQLREQLARAVEALNSAADGLEQVNNVYTGADESNIRVMEQERK